MPDYKQLYLKMFAATEDAINMLIATHRECEELYLSQTEPPSESEAQKAEK